MYEGLSLFSSWNFTNSLKIPLQKEWMESNEVPQQWHSSYSILAKMAWLAKPRVKCPDAAGRLGGGQSKPMVTCNVRCGRCVCTVPCIRCQAAEHVCEWRQSQSARLLHQEWVFIRRLLCVVLERDTLPPQPVKLALLKLVPHWQIHRTDSA